MWNTLALLSQGTEKIKENNLLVLLREFEALSMKPNENMEAFKTRVLNLVTTLATLGKDLSHKEVNSKVCKTLMESGKQLRKTTSFSRISQPSHLKYYFLNLI